MSQIKYDLIKARKKGVKNSIIEDAQSKGLEVTNYEFLPFFMCAIIEVKELKKLPDYMVHLHPCWEFEFKYPL